MLLARNDLKIRLLQTPSLLSDLLRQSLSEDLHFWFDLWERNTKQEPSFHAEGKGSIYSRLFILNSRL